ncbi:MAG: hypothetical protein IPK19_35950 [Chloroflexi bacterium]|nr:hypothetical protein [Chloroflexota bacterium]
MIPWARLTHHAPEMLPERVVQPHRALLRRVDDGIERLAIGNPLDAELAVQQRRAQLYSAY